MRYAIITSARPWTRIIVGAALLLGLLAPINCTPDTVAPPPPPPTPCVPSVLSVAIQPAAGTFVVNSSAVGILGADAGFTAIPTMSCGGPPLVGPSWSVDDTTVARPPGGQENSGVFRAIAPGRATITATWGEQQATIGIQVVAPPAMGPLVAVSAGNNVTCAVNAISQVFCWGTDVSHLVAAAGAMTTGHCGSEACSPVPLLHSAPGAVEQLDARGRGVCVLKVGFAWCWTNAVSPAPVPMPASVRFREISKGLEHTCGLDSQGAAFCWGNNDFGQLGDSTRATKSTPVPVAGNLRYAAISAGSSSSCAVTTQGAIYCWGIVPDDVGLSEDCDAGDKSFATTCLLLPTHVNLSGAGADSVFVSVSVGSHYCAISTAGHAYCWGGFDPQLLGLRLDNRATRPAPVETELLFQSISVGTDHTCALSSGGEAYCWGGESVAGLVDGQLGDGTVLARTRPTAVAGGLRFRSVSAGDKHTCGITLDGVGYCWGANTRGELGIGSQSASLVPARILGQ